MEGNTIKVGDVIVNAWGDELLVTQVKKGCIKVRYWDNYFYDNICFTIFDFEYGAFHKIGNIFEGKNNEN